MLTSSTCENVRPDILSMSSDMLKDRWDIHVKEGVLKQGGSFVQVDVFDPDWNSASLSLAAAYSQQEAGMVDAMTQAANQLRSAEIRYTKTDIEAVNPIKLNVRNQLSVTASRYPQAMRGLVLFATYQATKSSFLEKNPHCDNLFEDIDKGAVKIIRSITKPRKQRKRSSKAA